MIERGSMHLRHEMKYMLSEMEYHLLQNKLKVVLAQDPHCGSRGRYHIRSLYFDDYRNTALSDKLSGVAFRSKYRLRIYDWNPEVIKLERKFKMQDLIGKETATLTRKDVVRITTGDVSFLAKSENKLLRAFYLEYQRNWLRPNVIVDYEREAFIHPIGNVRITFDIGLHSGLHSVDLFNKDLVTVGITDYPIILEVKYDNILPEIIRGLLSCIVYPRCSISKFVNCKRFTQQNDWEDQ